MTSAFNEFKIKFDRDYIGEEHDHRLRVFYDNLKFIEDFYRSGPHSYTLGIAPFTDLTNEEFKDRYVGGY